MLEHVDCDLRVGATLGGVVFVTRGRSHVARAEPRPLLSRTIASDTRSGDRSDRTGLPSSWYRARAAYSSVAWHRSPRKPPRSRANSPRLRAAQSCSVRVIIFTPSHPSIGPARKGRGAEPPRVNEIGTRPPGRCVTPVEPSCPAVKTSSPRLPPRDAKHAVGGNRAWDENPGRRASSLPTVLPFGAFACANLKSLLGLLRGHRRGLPAPTAGPDSHRPCPPRHHRDPRSSIAKVASCQVTRYAEKPP